VFCYDPFEVVLACEPEQRLLKEEFMRILLVRHGTRAHKDEDAVDQLTDAGRGEICDLGRMLVTRGLKHMLYLTSPHKHAQQSAEILKSHTEGDIKDIEALQSPSRPFDQIFEEILVEAEEMALNLDKQDLVVLVSHEPGLSRLVTRLTSTRVRPMNRGEALCLEAASWRGFLEGQAEVKFRCPATNYEEKEFRDKLVSKMQVSTLLAGFTFTALIELLKDGKTPLTSLETVAVLFLTAAVALFVASVYLYDRLAMPAGFWLFGRRFKHPRRWSNEEEEIRGEHGTLYTHMVGTWNRVFTPGVVFAVAGLFAIFLRSRTPVAVVGALVAVVLTVLWYWRNQPPLGAD
jgi:phosphohistidine phosphatase SixA